MTESLTPYLSSFFILFVIEVQLSARALEYHLTDLKDKEDNIF